ncbi:Vesicle-associated protein 1-3 [Cardamine amara subsp. amara]|uniref:Vesicle-associated protein 1-3 n=1 Tax=Cardamine amara subsp. amara TaxID=228776 RepID=A0ABD1B3L7_CARAN
MTTGDLVNIHPTELKFPFELKKQSSCSMQLTNKTSKYVAFKVKTTNPRKYSVRPNTGLLLPGDSSDVTVTMQAMREAPQDMQCKDKFLVLSVIVSDGTTSKEVVAELFNKEGGKVIEEFKLRVAYIPANPPSPVPEGSEEGNSPRPSLNDIASQTTSSVFDDLSRTLDETNEKSSEAWSMISILTEEKTSAIQQTLKLRQELEVLKKESSKKQSSGGYSLVLMLLVGLLGCIIGYILNRT